MRSRENKDLAEILTGGYVTLLAWCFVGLALVMTIRRIVEGERFCDVSSLMTVSNETGKDLHFHLIEESQLRPESLRSKTKWSLFLGSKRMALVEFSTLGILQIDGGISFSFAQVSPLVETLFA